MEQQIFLRPQLLVRWLGRCMWFVGKLSRVVCEHSESPLAFSSQPAAERKKKKKNLLFVNARLPHHAQVGPCRRAYILTRLPALLHTRSSLVTLCQTRWIHIARSSWELASLCVKGEERWTAGYFRGLSATLSNLKANVSPQRSKQKRHTHTMQWKLPLRLVILYFCGQFPTLSLWHLTKKLLQEAQGPFVSANQHFSFGPVSALYKYIEQMNSG